VRSKEQRVTLNRAVSMRRRPPPAGGASFVGASDELYVAVANKKKTPYDTTPLGVLHYNTRCG
jgi:hypothetical protein